MNPELHVQENDPKVFMHRPWPLQDARGGGGEGEGEGGEEEGEGRGRECG